MGVTTSVANNSEVPDEVLQKAVHLRLGGVSYGEIARTLEIRNTPALRNAIVAAVRKSQQDLVLDIEAMLALDLARLEALIAANWGFAMQGSYQHTGAILKVMKQKGTLFDMITEAQKDIGAAMSDEVAGQIFTTNSPEYIRAVQEINKDAALEGEYSVQEDRPAVKMPPIADKAVQEQFLSVLSDLSAVVDKLSGEGEAEMESDEEKGITEDSL